jgi:hypothetical protein
MAKKRVGLVLPRASARVRQDAWDDLWPDALRLEQLPVTKTEFNAAQKRIGGFRSGSRKLPMARVCLVPKPNGLMRTAHQLTTDSRLYYRALVDTFMYDLDKRLVGKVHVFGYRPLAPRSTNAPFGFGLRQWKRFRAQLKGLVASGKYQAMVRTDLAAFFERVPHGPLEERLTSLGVREDTAKELRSYLKATMGKAHGLPQGPDPSGVLASAYLHPLDQAIIAAGYGYVRYVDDIVILGKTQTEAKRALRLLEEEARRLDLIVQSAKTELIVGADAMLAAVNDDDEIAAVDYVVKRRAKPLAVDATRKAWRSASRRTKPATRLIKYLIGRLTDNRDPIAARWCLARLGELDYLAPTVARYLSLFAGRPSIQASISAHLSSPENISEWEEMNLLRAMLGASKVNRGVLNRARSVLSNKNAGTEVREVAAVLLGKAGDPSDHDFVARECIDAERLALVAILALQRADTKTRGRFYADASARYAAARSFAIKIKGSSKPVWPVF